MSEARDSRDAGQPVAGSDDKVDFVSFTLADQLFGIPVLQVRDVLNPVEITPIPLTPPEILGSLNLRGRIVTAIDLRCRLGLGASAADQPGMSIVVDSDGELYSLKVDAVGEVLGLSAGAFEPTPATLDPHFRDFSAGIYRLEGRLLIALDVGRLLDYGTSGQQPEPAAAAALS